ncbi:MAG: hypothetical protein ACPL2D_06050 [Ignavibacteria bacterium]
MFKVKALISVLVIAVLFAFVGTTSAKEFPGDRAGKKADYLYKHLKLTNDQYAKIYQAYFDYEKKVDDLKKEKKDKKAYKDELTKLQNVCNAEIEKALNKDQSGKFSSLKEKVFKMSFVKKVKVTKTEENTEKKTEEKKDVKKEEKKDTKKDVKKEEKKDTKKDVKKEEKKDEKKK